MLEKIKLTKHFMTQAVKPIFAKFCINTSFANTCLSLCVLTTVYNIFTLGNPISRKSGESYRALHNCLEFKIANKKINTIFWDLRFEI